MINRRFVVLVCFLASAPSAVPRSIGAQTDSTPSRRSVFAPLRRIGSEIDDRARLDQLTSRATTEGFLLRSASSLLSGIDSTDEALEWRAITPELELVHNSDLPYSLNDGALWAGRGYNLRVAGGVRASWRRVRVTLAPELVREENESFTGPRTTAEVAWGPLPVPSTLSPFAYPWRVGPLSIDYPVRFGAERIERLDPGQSSIVMRTGALETGLASENQWWGPGIRNALLLSANAPGFPHLFLRSARPWRTRVGDLEWRWLVGGLSESAFFDHDQANDLRSISALAATWRPTWSPGLTVGAARTVYEPVPGWGKVPGRLFRVLMSTGRPNENADESEPQRTGPDQLFSLFGRLVLPADGFEGYAEWARASFPRTLRDFLIEPHRSQGYTLGLQWARPIAGERALLRLQGELSNLEQSPTFRDRPIGSWYTSRVVPQGYTQRGQPLGAAIGPGASSQFIGLDVFSGPFRAGAFASRIRWDNDSFYTIPWPGYKGWCEHDVTLAPGLRAGYSGRWGAFATELTLANRLNVFFDNQSECPKGNTIRDQRNRTLSITFSPPTYWR